MWKFIWRFLLVLVERGSIGFADYKSLCMVYVKLLGNGFQSCLLLWFLLGLVLLSLITHCLHVWQILPLQPSLCMLMISLLLAMICNILILLRFSLIINFGSRIWGLLNFFSWFEIAKLVSHWTKENIL